jgi:hypothetical protein
MSLTRSRSGRAQLDWRLLSSLAAKEFCSSIRIRSLSVTAYPSTTIGENSGTTLSWEFATILVRI